MEKAAMAARRMLSSDWEMDCTPRRAADSPPRSTCREAASRSLTDDVEARNLFSNSAVNAEMITSILLLFVAMRWNLPLVIFALFAGPGIYALLSLLQPGKLLVFGLLVGLPLLMIAAWGAAAMVRLLFP
ncbi:hypothetical protein [Desulfobulbus oligotrophicus]|uniref:Uncharacterized protein n=1 Tax=Desulfobulbus oligotrophicus TaxID=1909699 RepID=A0A7T5VEK8_9BACT|nr:hypothetical protein [Desulfobulbus oligotrophicus]QQG66361.1 hypothetical protein HP555_11020 [Desulfobulbus oligotrophicus]